MDLIISGDKLTVEDVVKVARHGEKVEPDKDAVERVIAGRKTLEKMIEKGERIYGINTGLGELVKVKIEKENLKKLQVNLVRSHSSGVGKYLEEELVRGAMLIRANSLLKGFSGVRKDIVEILIEFLNHHITPAVPVHGSVGASGDLAPLSHVALALIGEGEVIHNGKIKSAMEAMEEEGIKQVVLEEKEGLALLNGTAMMASYAALAVYDSYQVMKNALVSAAMSFEALKGTDRALDERIMTARGHPGQIRIAELLRKLLEGSKIIEKARENRVQDAYTLRCIPQVYGAVLDTIRYVKGVVEREINSATDNPLVFEKDVISGGNFHGEPIALAMDFLSIALTDLGNMIERRIARLVDGKLSGLPDFLMEESGLNSGLMIPQYTAAALCNRNKILAYPASADTIPTSANQEDHVSMGMNSAIKLREIVENVKYILAIEYLTANQALHIAGHSSKAVESAMKAINIPKFEKDAVFHEYIEDIKKNIDSEKIIFTVEKTVKITL